MAVSTTDTKFKLRLLSGSPLGMATVSASTIGRVLVIAARHLLGPSCGTSSSLICGTTQVDEDLPIDKLTKDVFGVCNR